MLEKLPNDEETPKLTGAEGVGYEYTRVALTKAIVLRGKGAVRYALDGLRHSC